MPIELARGPLMIDVAGPVLAPEDREVLGHPSVGGVILFRRNYVDPGQLRRLADAVHALRRPPLLVAVDQEGGRVQRLDAPLTRLPPARRIGELHDADPQAAAALQAAVGLVAGAELAALGIDIDFAPVLDCHDANQDVIGDRALHRDPQVVAALAEVFLVRLEAAGVLGVGKHFPGHGGCEGDTHLQTVRDPRSLLAVWEHDLVAYRRLIRRGRLPGVMCAHVEFPAIDPRPVGFSRTWVTEILRGRLGFEGTVFSDDLTMRGAEAGVAGLEGLAERVDAALAAGCDMALLCNDRQGAESILGHIRPSAPPATGGLPGAAPVVAPSWTALQAQPAYLRAREVIARLAVR